LAIHFVNRGSDVAGLIVCETALPGVDIGPKQASQSRSRGGELAAQASSLEPSFELTLIMYLMQRGDGGLDVIVP
jgi:hypothetical protein